MENSLTPTRSTVQMALIGALLSAVVAATTLILLLRARNKNTIPLPPAWREGVAGPTPPGHSSSYSAPQPAVGVEMPVQMPHHFSEDLIVPGRTETGQDVLEQDDSLGRSPEGV